MEWFLEYYNGWLQGGYFWWLYPVNGFSAPQEPWHTPMGFWMGHSILLTILILGPIWCVSRRVREWLKAEIKSWSK